MAKKNISIERGNRLQNLRKKVGLSRLAFAEQTGMSANTLKALELGERDLTPQKALLFSNLFFNLFSVALGEDAHEASFDYLYHGKKRENPGKKDVINDHNDERMQNDINFFTTNSAYTILKIPDDLMSPFYNKGDIVSGKKITNKKQFSLYQGHICIIETLKGDILLRRIIKAEGKKITFCILNTNASQGINIVEQIEAHSIAQAIWHWHLSELIQITHPETLMSRAGIKS
jgi:transcriptional regulator with XRE-family HTH domain